MHQLFGGPPPRDHCLQHLKAAQNFNVIFVFVVSISPWLHLLAGKRWDDLMGALKVFGKFWVHSKFLAN